MQSKLKQMENKIIADLAKYQKFKYHFLIGNLLFRSAIVNDTSAIVNKKKFLNEAKNDLGSCKLHKRLRVLIKLKLQMVTQLKEILK